MKIQCPYCGENITVNGLGRKRLNIPLKIVCDALQAQYSVGSVAAELNCSQAYIFGLLKSNGLKLENVRGKSKITKNKIREVVK